MSSLALSYDPVEGCADLIFGEQGLALDDGLSSLAMASLLTDARSIDPAHADDPRGWWGDALAGRDDRWGGLLWTLRREKALPEVLRLAEDYVRAALDWMVRDGIAAAVDAVARREAGVGSGATLAVDITIHRPDGSAERVLFDRLWEAMA